MELLWAKVYDTVYSDKTSHARRYNFRGMYYLYNVFNPGNIIGNYHTYHVAYLLGRRITYYSYDYKEKVHWTEEKNKPVIRSNKVRNNTWYLCSMKLKYGTCAAWNTVPAQTREKYTAGYVKCHVTQRSNFPNIRTLWNLDETKFLEIYKIRPSDNDSIVFSDNLTESAGL